MRVNEKYKMESSDLLNVTIFETYVGKEGKNKGEKLWKPISYHPNLESAFKYLVDREILEKKILELKAFKKEVFNL